MCPCVFRAQATRVRGPLRGPELDAGPVHGVLRKQLRARLPVHRKKQRHRGGSHPGPQPLQRHRGESRPGPQAPGFMPRSYRLDPRAVCPLRARAPFSEFRIRLEAPFRQPSLRMSQLLAECPCLGRASSGHRPAVSFETPHAEPGLPDTPPSQTSFQDGKGSRGEFKNNLHEVWPGAPTPRRDVQTR